MMPRTLHRLPSLSRIGRYLGLILWLLAGVQASDKDDKGILKVGKIISDKNKTKKKKKLHKRSYSNFTLVKNDKKTKEKDKKNVSDNSGVKNNKSDKNDLNNKPNSKNITESQETINEINELKNEINELNEKLNELKGVEDKNNKLNDENKILKQEKEMLFNENEQTKNDLKKVNQKINETNETLTDLNNRYETQAIELENYNKLIVLNENLDNKNKLLTEKLAEQNDANKNLNNLNNGQAEQIKKLDNQIDKLKKTNIEKDNTIKEKDNTISSLEKQVFELQKPNQEPRFTRQSSNFSTIVSPVGDDNTPRLITFDSNYSNNSNSDNLANQIGYNNGLENDNSKTTFSNDNNDTGATVLDHFSKFGRQKTMKINVAKPGQNNLKNETSNSNTPDEASSPNDTPTIHNQQTYYNTYGNSFVDPNNLRLNKENEELQKENEELKEKYSKLEKEYKDTPPTPTTITRESQEDNRSPWTFFMLSISAGIGIGAICVEVLIMPLARYLHSLFVRRKATRKQKRIKAASPTLKNATSEVAQ